MRNGNIKFIWEDVQLLMILSQMYEIKSDIWKKFSFRVYLHYTVMSQKHEQQWLKMLKGLVS